MNLIGLPMRAMTLCMRKAPQMGARSSKCEKQIEEETESGYELLREISDACWSHVCVESEKM